MEATFRSVFPRSVAVKWALYAGGYALVTSAIVLLVLGPVVRTVGTLLGLPSGSIGVVIIIPTSFFGALTWWGVVERYGTYTYWRGGTVGILTAGLTVLLWTAVTAFVYGPTAVLAGGILIGFVSVIVLPVGGLAAMPLMYVRRQRDDANGLRVSNPDSPSRN